MAAIEARGLSLTYASSDGAVQALSDVNLAVAPGEFVSLIGPSGCGETTLLRVIADLETPTGGTILVNGVTPEQARLRRDYGYVIQASALLPWRRIEGNVTLPLEVMGLPRAERRERARRQLELVGLAGFGRRFPWQLSGGMQQRVSIARAGLRPRAAADGRALRCAGRDRPGPSERTAARAVAAHRQDGGVRDAFHPGGGVPLDAHRGDVAAARPRSSPGIAPM